MKAGTITMDNWACIRSGHFQKKTDNNFCTAFKTYVIYALKAVQKFHTKGIWETPKRETLKNENKPYTIHCIPHKPVVFEARPIWNSFAPTDEGRLYFSHEHESNWGCQPIGGSSPWCSTHSICLTVKKNNESQKK